jgi:hypothetical protein
MSKLEKGKKKLSIKEKQDRKKEKMRNRQMEESKEQQ